MVCGVASGLVLMIIVRGVVYGLLGWKVWWCGGWMVRWVCIWGFLVGWSSLEFWIRLTMDVWVLVV